MDPGGFKKPWTALRKACGIEGRFHDFKHTFITIALRRGMNPVVVSEIVGTSIKVIQDVYLHLKPEDLYNDLQKLTLDGLGQNWDKGHPVSPDPESAP
jgi:integrase